jgi:hypothetical protein
MKMAVPMEDELCLDSRTSITGKEKSLFHLVVFANKYYEQHAFYVKVVI